MNKNIKKLKLGMRWKFESLDCEKIFEDYKDGI